ncbi:hypothetical protein M426DRAFT_49407, partial [Hypoxylon sp. CI-4A]
LHLRLNNGFKGSYMTLSHCWGVSGEILKLTMDTYEDRLKNGFSYAELPKTFQDAIRLSRFLHIDYIWIDSLCIIQGSKEDWMRESITMADVYRHSKCNIAATASSGPMEGCFYSRDPILISSLEISFRRNDDESSSSPEKFLFLDNSIWNRNVEQAPLNQRAWVMQERILSPRQIHCGREQLSWECYQATACETFPFSLDFGEDLSMESQPLTVNGTRATLEERIKHLKFKIYQDWMNIVTQYSSCALSYRSDKLVAIFGIASRIQDALKDLDEYVVGLWRSQLPWQLLWEVKWKKGHSSDDMAPSYDIGPSWSWA